MVEINKMSIRRNEKFTVDTADKAMWISLPHSNYQPITTPPLGLGETS